MESELRFYYANNKYEKLNKMIRAYKELNYEGCFYELTVQYDHPMNEKSFYNKEIDGRFRVRISKEINDGQSKAKISWKRRCIQTLKGSVNKEEEVELNFKYEELNNLKFLLEDVIQMKKVESYERYRNVFSNEDIEIVVDKYPFGIALEIENKSKEKNPEETILFWVNRLGLNADRAFRLSWDDKYTQLCKEQNVEIYKNVTFNLPMPEVLD
ncbi:MAG TPA: hypothetical protein OIM45_08450 [Clostridiaceae bacterium]|nr:hypothetical protein [Clostridiaceae bacterium]